MTRQERKEAEVLRDYVVFCAAEGRETPVLLSERERRLLDELLTEERLGVE